jgi:predicted nucleotidyltransferase
MHVRMMIKENLGRLTPAEREQEIARAVRLLAPIPGVRRIWLFGGAARERRLDWRSDLDFAVEGLPAGDLFGTWSRLDHAMRGPVDLVRIEDASPLLRKEILTHGRLLHDSS